MMIARNPGQSESRIIDSVVRAMDFVEENMGQPIGVEDMAKAAFFSLFYFSRIFSRATGHAPYDYLMRRRVAAAAEDIVNTDRSLTEIALDRGFDVPDSFTRAFRRCFGGTPSEARRERRYPRSIARTRIARPYVAAMLEYPPERPDILEAADLLLVGDWEPHSLDAWPRQDPYPVTLAASVRDGNLLPVRSFIGAARAGSRSLEAAEKERLSGIPPFPVSETWIPGGKRALFRIEGGGTRLPLILDFAYRSWIPCYGLSRTPAYDILRIGPDGPEALELPLD